VSNRTLELDPRTHQYLLDVSLREPPIMRELRERTARLDNANMQIAPEQGQFMAMLASLVAAARPAELGPPRFLEIGTFTGYSALSVTHAVTDASLVACDVSEEWTSIAREFWKRAGVDERIQLHLRPATETLASLLDAGEAATFDFAFIDADKTGYLTYYESCLSLLRPGGIVTLDNVLWDGAVADPDVHDEDTEALRAISRHVHSDQRVDLSMVPIGDGLTIARKR
jgi:predicted O-methyltransferase YrrM